MLKVISNKQPKQPKQPKQLKQLKQQEHKFSKKINEDEKNTKQQKTKQHKTKERKTVNVQQVSKKSKRKLSNITNMYYWPDLLISFQKLFLPLNNLFFSKMKSDHWVKPLLKYDTQFPIVVTSFPLTTLSLKTYETDSIGNTKDIVLKDEELFKTYFSHFMWFIYQFTQHHHYTKVFGQKNNQFSFTICGHSHYIRALIQALLSKSMSPENNIIVKQLSKMNSFSITLKVVINNQTTIHLILIRHGHSCHNQIKQISSNKSNIFESFLTNASRALLSEPKLSFYGTIGSIYLGTLLISLMNEKKQFFQEVCSKDNKTDILQLFGSSLIRTWLTILLLIVPNITNRNIKKIHLHISPFLKEVEIGKGNNRLSFQEQIEAVMDYFIEFVTLCNYLQLHFHLFQENDFFCKFFTTTCCFFQQLTLSPVYIISYLFQDINNQNVVKIFATKNDKNVFSIHHEINVKETTFVSEIINETCFQQNIDFKTNFHDLHVYRGFPIPTNDMINDSNLTTLFCSSNISSLNKISNKSNNTDELHSSLFSTMN